MSAPCEHCSSCPLRARMLEVLTSCAPLRPEIGADTEIWAADAILDAAAATFKIDRAVLVNESRARPVVLVRQVAMYVARQLTSASFPVIGEVFDRDHSTVMYAVTKIGERLDDDAQLASMVARLQSAVLEGAA